MKCLERNKFTFYYCLRSGEERELDENGYETGERFPIYDAPVEMRANISWATGRADTEQFGVNVDYDKVIVTDEIDCPIDETTVLFVDKEPEFVDYPKYDYIVQRVSKSKHYISYAIKRVDVT